MSDSIKQLQQEMHKFVNTIDKLDMIKEKLINRINVNKEVKSENVEQSDFTDQEYSQMKIDIQKIRQAIKEAYNSDDEF